MTNSAPSDRAPAAYTGIDNLEVMREAQNYNRYLQSLVEHHAGGASRVVDFGAGSGTFAIPCMAAGLDVTAVEPDGRLRAHLEQAGITAVADVAALPDETFHYAYTLNVLEHIENDVEALRALRAKLAPKARLFVYVPAFPVLFSSMDAKVGHVRRYTRRTLTASLRAAGFDIRTMCYVDSLGFAATLLFKAIDDGKGNVNRRLLRVYDRLAFPVSRIVDTLTHRWLGKNLMALATNGLA
jgi:SAM-dependent methyltransferase